MNDKTTTVSELKCLVEQFVGKRQWHQFHDPKNLAMSIAIEAADITLVRGDLSGVVSAVKLSRATFNKVIQGLFWAFFYNVVMIPLAILGMMHPVLAEIAMATSSVTVVTNANLLRRVDIRPSYAQH